MSEWQPIESAPKIPFQVILLGRYGQHQSMPVYWNGDNWMCATIFGQGNIFKDPDVWSYLPEPPK